MKQNLDVQCAKQLTENTFKFYRPELYYKIHKFSFIKPSVLSIKTSLKNKNIYN